MGNLEQSFIEKFVPEPNSGCWLWDAAITSDGYGFFGVGGKMKYAHRISYEAHKGPIPIGLVIDHLCSVPCCVNPDHLEVVTQQENSRRTVQRGRHQYADKRYCKHGHEFTEENTYFRKNRKGRACHTCLRALRKKYREKQR